VAPHDGTLPGELFESLVTLCARVCAQRAEARTAHLRAWSGDREIDLIVERGPAILALEIKLGQTADDRDVRHLWWLQQELGDDLVDAVVVTTGPAAYRGADGLRLCRRRCWGMRATAGYLPKVHERYPASFDGAKPKIEAFA